MNPHRLTFTCSCGEQVYHVDWTYKIDRDRIITQTDPTWRHHKNGKVCPDQESPKIGGQN